MTSMADVGAGRAAWHRASRLLAAVCLGLLLAACEGMPAPSEDLSQRHELLKGQERPMLRETRPTTAPKDLTGGVGQPRAEAAVTPGTGAFVRNIPDGGIEIHGPALPAQHAPAHGRFGEPKSPPSGEVVTLNYVNAAMRDVIRDVLGEILGLHYEISPDVVGKTITLQSRLPLDKAAVLPVLDSILRMNDAAIVVQDGLYRVVPLDQADNLAPAGSNVEILALRYASAQQLLNVLQPFAAETTVLQIDPARNVMIVAGPPKDVASLVDLAMAFDVDWLAGMSYALVPVANAQPSRLVPDLERIFQDAGQAPLAGVVRFIPIDRRNTILVAAKQKSYLDRARSWIARLDAPDADEQTIHVYPLQYRRAADVADILLSLVEGSGVAVVPGPEPVPEIGQEGAAGPPGGDAAALPPVAGTADTGVRITADTLNNAIVVLAREADYKRIKAALERLDTRPAQVLIEATIAEVTLNDALRYGIQWFFEHGDSQFQLRRGSEPVPSIGLSTTGFSYFLSADDVRLAIDALRSVTDVEIVSTPQVMVLDNQTARLQIGDQVPIVTRTAQSVTDPDAPIVNTIEYRDTGVVLSVTPRVNQSGLVVLDIIQEVSNVNEITTATLAALVASPTIEQRKVESTVAVQSGDTIALGGLISDERQNDQDGIPLLGDIPILGNLFKSNFTGTERRELLVLIRPRIIHNPLESWTATEELRRRIRNLQSEDRGKTPSVLDYMK